MDSRLDRKKKKQMQRMQELNALVEVYMKHECLEEVFIYMDLHQNSSWLKRWTCPITIKHIMKKNSFLWTLMHMLFPFAAIVNYIVVESIVGWFECDLSTVPSAVVLLLAMVCDSWLAFKELDAELLMHQQKW